MYQNLKIIEEIMSFICPSCGTELPIDELDDDYLCEDCGYVFQEETNQENNDRIRDYRGDFRAGVYGEPS